MKIFLSSTYNDLAQYRKAASDAIDRLGHHGTKMEVFGARPEEPINACLKEIDACDLFVGIYAHRYGFIPEGSSASITELEYRHAKKLNKPLFCFVINEDHPWPPKLIEDEPGKGKLAAFKKTISQDRVQDNFTTQEDLAFKIASSLGRYLAQNHSKKSDQDVDQVAAICYRGAGDAVEFLLIKTSGRRWLFPKGKIDKNEEEWVAAEREAFEESGAMGRIERKRLTVFLHRKQELKERGVELKVAAYLLCVESQPGTGEKHRCPTWFNPDKAIEALAESREFKYANELKNVINMACSEIG